MTAPQPIAGSQGRADRVIQPQTDQPRIERLRRRQEFLVVLQDGRRWRHPLLSLGVRPNGLEHTRIGYAIGKRVGPAVVRNRVRRRLREIMRALLLVPGYDLVLTAGPRSANATFGDLTEAVRSCASRANITKPWQNL